MKEGQWMGLAIAAALAVLSFFLARVVTRCFQRRQAARQQALELATQSRQVRRANARRNR
ncbi:hypothetical protein [Hydrogenophaga sp.]